MRLTPLSALVPTLALLAGPLATPVTAQTAGDADVFEWVGLLGAMVPTTDLVTVSGLGTDGGVYTLRQQPAVAFGFRIAAWWTRAIGWDATFSYLSGKVEAFPGSRGDNACGSTVADCTSNSWRGSSRLLFRYAGDDPSVWNIYGALGLAVVGHYGEVWHQEGALTDLGGVVGVGGTYEFSRRFALRVDVEDYLYTFDPDFASGSPLSLSGETRGQNDMLISAGIVIRILGR